MNILIICTHYPPDSSVAAVKPFELSKYLSEFGHNITVVRLGVFWCDPDESYGDYKKNIEVVSAMGIDCDAEKFDRNEYIIQKRNQSRIKTFIKEKVPNSILSIFRLVLSPFLAIKEYFDTQKKIELMNNAIRMLYDSGKRYDVVFSTYNQMQNIFAGDYASKLFKAKWIHEFRDPAVIYGLAANPFRNIYAYRAQKYAITYSDITTSVCEAMRRDFLKISPKSRVEVLYNGYDSDTTEYYAPNSYTDTLSICYTGTMYDERVNALESLVSVMSELVREGRIDRNKLKYRYAGGHSEVIKGILKKYGLLDILEDHGYVSRDEAQAIQQNSDIFLVLSWNTKASQGVLTGKFYEGIRAGRPILSVITGDVPESELWELNKKYHYGYCYESCRGKAADDKLKEFILGMYERKFSDKGITYKPNPDLVQDFHYKNITKKLERLMLELVNEDKK